jgi:transport and Golgi organization protein 2
MCTVTWSAEDGGYDLFMNRDELHTRGHALPPRLSKLNGVSYLAPTDSDAGGSWIAVNEFGITACLLNNYPPDARIPANPISRGRLLIGLIEGRSVTEIDSKLRAENLDHYRPFHVFVIGAPSATAEARLFRWDGSGALVTNPSPEPPITTSSFETGPVVQTRTDFYAKQFAIASRSPDELGRYHRSHEPAPGAYSVCVHRDDAGTKSLSHISVRPGFVNFAYTDGPPCEGGPVTETQLEIVAQG